ncbi:unnamed protein product [Rotaria magnacalcarata]|uniref:Alpha-mannosidase n=2 Tax=Rotaria magnacalcarata TaxID=392030 RepID=A0A814XU05_9BILA|nr:unnamed protein product [Rotaria magnacalcarata]
MRSYSALWYLVHFGSFDKCHFARLHDMYDRMVIDYIPYISFVVCRIFELKLMLKDIFNLKKSFDISFSNQGFYWYQGFSGNNSHPEFQASGAYVFRPLTQTAEPVSQTRTVTCIKALSVQTAVIVFNDWASQEISLYDEAQNVEVEWTIGPIPVNDNIGKEIIIRYDTDIQSQAKYYTDANGLLEPVSGNYYPVNSRIWIKDQNRQFTVLTDRSEGGASLHDGSIEIMLHRRLLYDDDLGVSEALNESAFGEDLVVRGRHSLIVDASATSALVHRVSAQNMYMHPLAVYSLTQQTFANYSAVYRLTWSALTNVLPLNVHLLTLDQLGPKDYLIRVEHYFEMNEDDTYSHPVTIDLQSILKSIGTITNTVELTLGGNLPLAELQRLNWVTSDKESSRPTDHKEQSLNDTSVRLTPMQIRTFQVTVA